MVSICQEENFFLSSCTKRSETFCTECLVWRHWLSGEKLKKNGNRFFVMNLFRKNGTVNNFRFFFSEMVTDSLQWYYFCSEEEEVFVMKETFWKRYDLTGAVNTSEILTTGEIACLVSSILIYMIIVNVLNLTSS